MGYRSLAEIPPFGSVGTEEIADASILLADLSAGLAAAIAVSGGVVRLTVAAVYAVVADDAAVVANGAVPQTVNLPAVAASANRRLVVKRASTNANAVVVAAAGADTIDGAANVALPVAGSAVGLVCDGTTWHLAP